MAIKNIVFDDTEYKISYEIFEPCQTDTNAINSANQTDIAIKKDNIKCGKTCHTDESIADNMFKNKTEFDENHPYKQNILSAENEKNYLSKKKDSFKTIDKSADLLNFENKNSDDEKNLAQNCDETEQNNEKIKQNSKIPQILIIHGWGANKELMIKAFAKHFKRFRQIYIDLPGFGKSSISKPLTTKIYAKIVREFMQKFGEFDAVLGHSFGGKVAAVLNPKNLILLSSAGILEPKPFKVRAKIAFFKLLKNLGLGKFYKLFISKDVAGMSPVMYETFKNVVNEDFSKIFANVNPQKCLIFWGEEDHAVSLKSGEKIAELIKNSKFFKLKGDHFFFLLHPDFITQNIEKEILC